MRLHITLEDELVGKLDRRVGSRRRSAFISETVRRALEDEQRWDDVEAGLGALAEHEHEIRFVLLDPDGGEVAGGAGSLVARGAHDGRDNILTFSIDLWNVTFPSAGDYSFRILVNGSERKRLPLVIAAPDA